jgi:O-antigen/teichoic acid export membrane protein
MSSLKLNTIANFIGQVWVAVIGFILVPIYIRYLGIESYGLLGFFISLQALVAVMDLGLSITANREVARCTSGAGSIDNLNAVLITLQYIYIVFGALIALVFFLSADLVTTKWITANGLANDILRKSFILFGIIIGIRWPIALYSGILRGLEKQLRLNYITIAISTLRGVGSAVLVVFISRSITHLLLWQLLSGIFELLSFSFFAWSAVPHATTKIRKFSINALKSVLGFSSTVALISIFAIIIKQLDKVIISKLLPLEEMGYYATAFQAFTAIQLFITPVSTAVFPRLSAIISSKDENELAVLYHKSSKIIAFATAPIAALFIFYSHDILTLWTQSEVVGDRAFMALSLMAIAAMLNSVMQSSYILQLASGLQRIALFNNIISCLLITPLTYYLVFKYGINGGALSWSIYNVVYFSIIPNITHRHILKGHLRRWYTRDTIPFMVLAVVLTGVSFIISYDSAPVLRYSVAVLTLALYFALSMLFDKDINGQFKELSRIFSKFAYSLRAGWMI